MYSRIGPIELLKITGINAPVSYSNVLEDT